MVGVVIVVVAVAVVAAVFAAAGRSERRPRLEGRSIYRDRNSHVNVDGRPKVAYPTREVAESAARAQGEREGQPMRAYACGDPRCGAYHIGHG